MVRQALAVALAVASLSAALAVPSPGVLAADPRCNGTPGYQVWEHSQMSGRAVIWCVNVRDFSQDGTNLNFSESWNDRISSFQTFNMVTSRRTCFWFAKDYQGDSYGVWGNKTVLYVGDYYNDKFSSVKSPDSSGC